MKVKTRSIEALLNSDAVLRAPPAVQNWLAAVLTRGEGANSNEESHMADLKDHHTYADLMDRYDVTYPVVAAVVAKLGVARRHGRLLVVAEADLPRIEAALLARGHSIDKEVAS